MQYLALACRVSIAIVFAMAVAGKVVGRGAFREFTRSIVGMEVVSPRAVEVTAAASVTAEGLTLVLAVTPLRTTSVAACALAGLLSVAFSVTIVQSLRRGNHAPCRCFGRSATPLGARHIARNAVLLVVSILGVSASLERGTLHVPAAIVAAAAGLFVGLIIAAFDDIAELVSPSR